MKAVDLRPGQAIRMDGRLFIVTKFETTKPGKGPSYAQVKMKDVVGGNSIERRFGTADNVEDVFLDRAEMEYLYSDADGAVFMNTETYDQVTVPEAVLGDALLYLRPNTSAVVLNLDGQPISLDLPGSVVLKVTDTTPGIKGATATNQLKPATLETGLATKVPPFIEIGEEIKVSTEDGSYMSRSKE